VLKWKGGVESFTFADVLLKTINLLWIGKKGRGFES